MQGQLTPSFGDYELIDTGDFEKLERFGQYVARRPEPQAIWRRSLPEGEWRRMADAAFLRDVRSDERGEWRLRPSALDGGLRIQGYGASYAPGAHLVQACRHFPRTGRQLEFHLR